MTTYKARNNVKHLKDDLWKHLNDRVRRYIKYDVRDGVRFDDVNRVGWIVVDELKNEFNK
jgi:hypothetical protein